jgi:hypothetical protein
MYNLVVYIVLIFIIIILSFYYNELNKKKIILQEFFTNDKIVGINENENSVFSSLTLLTKDYKNLQEKNNILNSSLAEDHYNKYAKDIENRYTSLGKNSAQLGITIKEKQSELKRKAQAIQDAHKSDYIKTEKDKIINRNIQSINDQLSLNDLNSSQVKRIVSNIINQNVNTHINRFREQIPNNNEVQKNIDDVYNKAKQNLSSNMGAIQERIKDNIDKYVKESLEKKKLTLPFEDLSKYQGVLVRTYNSESNGNYGLLLNEYVIPSINYYMADRKDGFFNTQKKNNQDRFLDFLGFIQFPQDVNTLQFYISTGAGVRLYFGGQLLIDKSNSNMAVEQTTRMVYGQPNAKVPFKIQINEGSTGNSSYIILKWRKNDSGVYDVVPSSNFFLPNLKSY